MFTRPMFETADMSYQSELLAQVAKMIDAGTLQGILTKQLEGLTAQIFCTGHEKIESSRMIGNLAIYF